MKLTIETPRWAIPLLAPNRLKGAKGGRASGKSHERAEALVERMICEPDLRWVCVREIQKSLKFSSKQIIEDKIKKFEVSHLFDITLNEIRRTDGDGVVIFQGMQDHTADSIKSLEGFDGAWCEEAQSLSRRSIDLLVPTIRKEESELWFTWNPDRETDAVERLFKESPGAVLVHVNYTDNPWCPQTMKDEAMRQRAADIERYNHIWLGGFNEVSAAQVFRGKYRVSEFEPLASWDGPYNGLDFGFSQDPTAAVKAWVSGRALYIEHDFSQVGLELDDTAQAVIAAIPGIEAHTVRADNARPESISYLKRHGLPRMAACQKGKGSVEDGVEFIKSFDEVVIHPRCKATIDEFNNYSYKVDRLSGDIMPVIVDDFNHVIDALRYALEPIMKNRGSFFTRKR